MSTPDTQRWALTLSYDGSRFYGWHKQAGGVPTVQTALENALAQIAGEAVSTIVAGRTDTGVHATDQVVHFDTAAVRPPPNFMHDLTHTDDITAICLNLPPSVRRC